jgi:hypothetical protein
MVFWYYLAILSVLTSSVHPHWMLASVCPFEFQYNEVKLVMMVKLMPLSM